MLTWLFWKQLSDSLLHQYLAAFPSPTVFKPIKESFFSLPKPLSTDNDILPTLFVEQLDCVCKGNRSIEDMHVFPYI